LLNQKINSAYLKYQSDGRSGLLMLYPRRLYHWIQSLDTFWGHIVELRNNLIRIDGLKFHVDVPAINTSQKAKFLFDRYERPERLALKQFLDPEVPVIEFGGNIGIVSCIINKRLKNPEQHIVIEANPELIPGLERNRHNNQCQFQIINCAIAQGCNEVAFNISNDTLGSSVQIMSQRSVIVPAITLKTLLKQYKFSTCTLVCDIEGGEIDLIKYESDLIKERVSTIFMEVHAKFTGQAAVDSMLTQLLNLRFEIVFNRWSNIVLQNKNKNFLTSASY
jgi:FkbM family methyltransferase